MICWVSLNVCAVFWVKMSFAGEGNMILKLISFDFAQDDRRFFLIIDSTASMAGFAFISNPAHHQ